MDNKKQMGIEDIIDVLCHYDYERIKIITNSMDSDSYLCGMALDSQRQIYVDKDLPLEEMRETVLHELYHCHHFLKGNLDGMSYNAQEKYVDKQTKEHLKDIYKTKRLDL